MSQPTDLNDPDLITKTKPMNKPFFPDDAPLPLEIHGLDQAKAVVYGTSQDDTLLVEVDDDATIWVRVVGGDQVASLFIAPEKAAAIGNAFLRFAELAVDRMKENKK